MKIEQLIVQYLYKNKKVTLQDIGTFTLTPDLHIPTDGEKDTALPANSIHFDFDKKALVDEGLIVYIMENTRKIRPLATSDLESYLSLNKQFLNIGKPLVLDGIGVLQKTQQEEFSFVQALNSNIIAEDAPKLITEKVKEKISFATPQNDRKENSSKNIFKLILGVVVVGLLGAVAYYIAAKNNNTEVVKTAEPVTTTASDNVITKDTLLKPTTIAPSTTNIRDSNTFYIVIKEFTDYDKAKKAVDRLATYGNNVSLFTKDSSLYKMRMPFRKSITDTLMVKDSLIKFFQA